MMRRMKRQALAVRLSCWLLCSLLAACASSPPTYAAEEPLEEVYSSFEEGCADPTTVVLLCEGPECGFFRCHELEWPEAEQGAVQLTRGGGFIASPAAPGRRPGRWRGGAWPRGNSGPVLTFRFYSSLAPKPPPARFLLPPGRYVRHHLFSQAPDLAQWFRLRGVNIHDFTMVIAESVHHRIHSGGPRGGLWNEAWRQFRKANEYATPEQIYRHAGELIYRFELLGPIVPYYSRQR